jgi:hypothetical protein
VVLAKPSSGLGKVWLILAVLAVGGFALILELKTDVFHPERKRAKEEAAARQAEERQRAEDAKKVRTGDLSVTSVPDKAAVWLLLGKAPTDSIELPTGMDHQIRVDGEGFKPYDVTVSSASWTGVGEVRTAHVKAPKLEVAPIGFIAPAYPPPPPNVAPPAGATGRGRIHVESEPAGANVWLLVGYTGTMRMTALRIDREYEFRLAKDGFVPATVVVKPDKWKDGAGWRNSLDLTTELTERPVAPPPKK